MLGLVCFFMMLVSYLECGFSLLPDRKSFRTRGTPFYSETRKNVNTFLSMIGSFESTLTHVKCVLPNTFITTGLLPDINRSPRRAFLHRARPARDCMWASRFSCELPTAVRPVLPSSPGHSSTRPAIAKTGIRASGKCLTSNPVPRLCLLQLRLVNLQCFPADCALWGRNRLQLAI